MSYDGEMTDLLNGDDYLTEILHKVLSYHPEQRITIERYKSGVVRAYQSTLTDGDQIISKDEIPLTDDLLRISWDFGYQVAYAADGTHGYRWFDFRQKPDPERKLDVIAASSARLVK